MAAEHSSMAGHLDRCGAADSELASKQWPQPGDQAANWLADPTNSLPAQPDPLPIGLDDNGDAVEEHDAQEAEYYRSYASSRVTRLRMTLKAAADPFDPSTERQILTGIGILSALAVWRLNEKRR